MMIPNDYSNKICLVIDDFYDFRRAVRDMLLEIRVKAVDMAADAKEALELCRRKRFNIVICDYNLGEGKDGQELHEELMAMQLIDYSTVYIMATAEDGAAMVLASLECEPDAYLTKPFARPILKNRLDKILQKKAILSKIHRAIAQNNKAKAIMKCDALVRENPRYQSLCIRLKADLLMQLERFEEAKEIYANALGARPLPWAQHGMGRVLYQLGDYGAALSFFKDALAQSGMSLANYDWLAKTELKLGNRENAVSTLSQALKLSPKSSPRQMMLGKVATELEDYETAVKAYRGAVRYGKFSRHKQPDNYLNLAKSLYQTMDDHSGLSSKRAADEAHAMLKTVSQDYKRDKEVLVRAGLIDANIFQKQQSPREAESRRLKALQAAEGVNSFRSPDAYFELADAYNATGQPEKAQQCLKQVVEQFHDNDSAREKVEELIDDKSVLVKQETARELNNTGMRSFEEGDFKSAIKSFKSSLESAPKNVSYLLNMIQAILEELKIDKDNPKSIDEAMQYLGKIGGLSTEDARYGRYQELLRRASQFKAGTV